MRKRDLWILLLALAAAVTVSISIFASSALETGAVDAMCMDGSIAWGYLDDDRSYVDMKIGEQPYAVATLKGSPLSGPIDEAVRALLSEGFMEALTDKWL